MNERTEKQNLKLPPIISAKEMGEKYSNLPPDILKSFPSEEFEMIKVNYTLLAQRMDTIEAVMRGLIQSNELLQKGIETLEKNLGILKK